MSFLLAAACLAPGPLEWSGWWYEQIEKATLVVAGEVVGFKPHGEKNLAAVYRVDRVYKGSNREKELILPFKTKLFHACDYEIRYERAKYLLLLDDEAEFRLVWFPDCAQIRIETYEAPEVLFTRAVIGLRAGIEPEKRILDLVPLLGHPRGRHHLDLRAFVSTLPRRVVRPILPALRRELGPDLKAALERAKPEDRFRKLDEAFVTTFDLALVEGILARPEPFADPIFQTKARRERGEEPIRMLSRVIGREFTSIEALRAAWPTALRRSRAEERSDGVPALFGRLGSDDPHEREAAAAAILDLGPGALEAVRVQAASPDPEIRARVAALVSELEFLRELRDGG
jgi:hypothetical protein